MGCCQSTSKYGAFRSEINNPLLDSSSDRKVPSEAVVVIVRLMGMKDIQGLNSFSGTSDPFVEMKLFAKDEQFGFQRQLSSIKPSTINPQWVPPEKFQFVVCNPKDTKIVISAYHFNSADQNKSSPLGDTLLKVKDFDVQSSTPKLKSLKLINPSNGKPVGEVELSVLISGVDEAKKVQEHTAYEYQRWQPVLGWGSTDPPGHLLPTDRGRWCTEDGKKFGKEIEDVSPAVPAGWKMTISWHTISTESDPEGWQYSMTFDSPFWYPVNDSSSYVVRRRVWQREVRKDESDERSDSESSSGPVRRRRMFNTKK